MEADSLNRIAYLDTLEKKPFDLLLELIEIECFPYEFANKTPVSTSGVHITKILADKYSLVIPEFILNKWIQNNFDLRNSKLVLKSVTEELSFRINCIKQREEKFLKKMNEIKQDFIVFSLQKFNIKIDKEDARKIFDSYIYSAAHALVIKKNNDISEERYFIFQDFLKKLSTTDVGKLSLIESFGIANQIQNLIIYSADSDEKFLDGCHIFLDTPILMRRLGYDGKDFHDNYAVFLNSILRAGAKEYVFEHTFDEIWGILFNFKRCVALNILNAKGVSAFLEARKEFTDAGIDADTILTLDKNELRENIENLGAKFIEANDEGLSDSDYSIWDFDEDRFIEILKQESGFDDSYKAWMEKDKKSVSAIHRMRSKEHITQIDNYKDGRYYLLVDNFALISALKKYYKVENFYPHKNELLLESTLLFQLWQQTENNDKIIRSLFRSKCFAMNVIDENFRDKLYRNARRLEAYNSNLDVKDNIIDNPALESEIYTSAIKDNKLFDESYIASTLQNKISIEKKKIRDEIKQRDKKIEEERIAKNGMSVKIEKLTRLVEEKNFEHEQDKRNAIEQTRSEEKASDIERVARNLQITMSFLERVKIFIKGICNKQFNEKEYFHQKAELLLSDDGK